jgi:hypothetical protein
VTRTRLSDSDTKSSPIAEGREGEGGLYISTSFSSLPKDLFDMLSDTAKNRHMFPRDLFSEAILYLVSERNRTGEIAYAVARKGGVKRTIWLSEEACKSIETVSKDDRVNKNTVFLTSLQLYAEKEGLHV